MARLLWILAAGCLLSLRPAPADGWKPLFNGRDLTGWHILNGTATYAVAEGAIVGTSVTGSPNTFLATTARYDDFVLELEVWVDPALNSGIQIRSESRPDYQNGRVHGYQVEIDPSSRAWSGGIYDEARRGWLYPLDINPTGRRAFVTGQWNTYRIECIGSSVRTWVNGLPCADLVDTVSRAGFIALQVHSIDDPALAGKQIRWRNIRIRTENLTPSPWTDIRVVNLVPNTLSPQEKAQGWILLFDGKTTDGWRGAHKSAFPAKGWAVTDGILRVQPSTGAESQNGGDIVTLDTFSRFEFQAECMLKPGANSGIKYFVTEQYPTTGSAIGLEFQLLDDALHPDAKLGAAGNRTIGSLYDLIPAHTGKSVNPPGSWNHVRLVVAGTLRGESPAGNQTASFQLPGAYVEHWLNHRQVLRYTRGDQAFDALVARSKYAGYEGFGRWPSGRILLQDHGDEVMFRSIKVRRL
ncbi:MAG: DUF1080 domain-containing protein [Bacteroidia bacterium]|nr:DUF1080 domain-containing protein [Bacteroidia bacterium]